MKKRKRVFGRIVSVFLSTLMAVLPVLSVPLSNVQAAGPTSAVITKDYDINYANYAPIGSYVTGKYRDANTGNFVYCIESEKAGIPQSRVFSNIEERHDLPMLSAVLAMGPGGPLYEEMKAWWKIRKGIDLTEDQAYLYTHVCANYAYQCANPSTVKFVWKGYDPAVARDFFSEYLWYCADLAVGNAETPSGKNYHNFYCYIVLTGNNVQNVGMQGGCEEWTPTPTSIKITVGVRKIGASSDPDVTVEGAKYGVYRASDNQKLGEITIGPMDPSNHSGYGEADFTINQAGQYYIKEISNPSGFKLDDKPYPFNVMMDKDHALYTDCDEITINGRAVAATVTETPDSMKFSIKLKKLPNGQEWTTNPPSLKGAVYCLVDKNGNEVVDDKGKPITRITTEDDPSSTAANPIGTAEFVITSGKGRYGVKEVSAPTGYTVDPEIYWFDAIPEEGTDKMGVIIPEDPTKWDQLGNRTLELSITEVKDATGSFAFQKYKSNGTTIGAGEAGFYLYNRLDVKKNADGTFDFTGATPIENPDPEVGQTDTKMFLTDVDGFVIGVGIKPGTYVFHEVKTPSGLLPVDFMMNIEANKISYPNLGYGDGIVVDTAPGSLKITKSFAGTVPAQAATKTFKFTVTGPNDYYKEVEIQGEGSKTLTGLTLGEYKVVEDSESAKIDGVVLSITGDNNTPITVTDTRVAEAVITNEWVDDHGSLRIIKALGANPPAEALAKDYTFSIAGPHGYTKNVKIHGAGEQIISGLEFGEYVITEDVNGAEIAGYKLTVDSASKTATISAVQQYDVKFTNTYTPGSLKITKTLDANAPDAAKRKTFKFDVTGPDNYSTTVEITGAGSQTLTGLKLGEYTIKEQEASAEVEGYKLTITGSDVTKTVTAEQVAEAVINNKYDELGKLQITKKLGANAPADALTKKYKFTVTGPNNYSKEVEIEGANTVTVSGLEYGDYTVTENTASAEISGYKLTVSGDNKKTKTVTATDVAAFEITNTYTPGSLKITKKLNADAPASATTKVYKFDVTGPDGYSKLVEITGASSQTLTGLKLGEYTIKERTDDAKITGYSLTVTGDNVTKTVTAEDVAEAIITNTYTELGKLQVTKVLGTGAPTDAATKKYKFTVTGPNGYSENVEVEGAGYKLLENLEPGDYTVTENTTDAEIPGYKLTVTGNGAVKTVAAKTTVEAKITNTYTKLGSLQITKRLDANAPADALIKTYKFTITGPNGYSKNVEIIGAGTHLEENLQPGSYTVKEDTDAAQIPDYDLTVVAQKTTSVALDQTAEVDFTNTYTEKPSELVLYKTISGDITQDELDGKLKFEVTAPSGAKTTYTVGEGNFKWNATEKRYELSIKPAEVGKYYVEETTTTKEGYDVTVKYHINTEAEQTGSIAEADVAINKVTTVWFDNKYDTRKGKIKIVKQIEGKITPADLDTLKFTITPEGETTPVKTLTIKDNFTKVGDDYESEEIELEKGKYTVTETVTYGTKTYTVTYKIDEGSWNDGSSAAATVVPKNLTKITFKNKYESGSIKIVKKLGANPPTEALTKTFKFHIEGPNGYTKDVEITGASEQTITDLDMGDYVITENVDDAMIANYTLVVSGLQSSTPLVEATKNVTVEITNTYTFVKTGKLTLYKEGESVTKFENGKFVWETKPIPGAEFDVFAEEDIYDTAGVKVLNKDDKVDHLVTGTDGNATTIKLPLGKYYAVETKEPTGYIIDKTPIHYELKEDTTTQEPVVTKTVFNERKKVVLDMKKVDKNGSKPLAGGEFTLTAAEDVKNYAGAVIVSKGSKIEAVAAGTDGKLAFTVDLPMGTYKIEETKAPEGYNADSTPITFKFEGKQDLETITYTFENTELKAALEILKKGESVSKYENGQFVFEERSLEGAEFDLRKKGSDTVIGHYKTDKNGNISIKDLDAGFYTLTETKAPYGMVLDTTPVEVEAKKENGTTVIPVTTIINDRQKIVLDIQKVDQNGSKPLTGGEFIIYAEEDIKNYKGDVIVPKDTPIEIVSAKDGKVVFTKDLPHAKYYIKENKAPDGYNKTDTPFHIDATYKDATIKKLGITLVIKNDKPTPPPDTPPKTPPTPPPNTPPTNYRTGDDGQGGYSVLIRDAANDKTAPVVWPFAVGGCGIIAIGAAFAVAYTKKKKVKATEE